MPSKGTARYTFRLPPELMMEVEATIQLRNEHTTQEEWDLSEFVRVALREKVSKMDRCRGTPIVFYLLPPNALSALASGVTPADRPSVEVSMEVKTSPPRLSEG